MSATTISAARVPVAAPRSRPVWHRLLLGRETDPRWVRPALWGVLLATAVLYVVDLSASGYGNSFYAAAVQAGTKSWKAFLFGSFDSSNFITVDKPPASLWVMELFARVFGFSSWSLLVPQAIEGVACVAVLYATVRRRFSAAAALIAAAALALTPVAALMFRYDNPDALLVLLLTASAYAVVRGLEQAAGRGGTRWMAVAGVLLGLAFLTKSLQAFLVLPAFGVVFLLAAGGRWRRRLWQLLALAAGMVVSAGWWLATVALWPAASRPYIGGSQDNSEWNLIFGYNGFGRLTGNESGSVGGAPTGSGMWGSTGLTRLLGSDMASQISWLLPAAFLFGVGLLWLWRRSGRGDPGRAQVGLWLGWLMVTALVFSYAKGIIHPYYTVALAPPIAALVGIGAVEIWRRRESFASRACGAAVLTVTSIWAAVLLDRSPQWLPWLRLVILLAGLGAAGAFLAGDPLRRTGLSDAGVAMATLRSDNPGARGVAVVAIASALAGPAAYAVAAAATPATGAIPSAGPAATASDLFSAAGGRGFGPGGFGGGRPPGPPGGTAGAGGGVGLPAPPGVAGTGGVTGGTAVGGPPGGGGAAGGLLQAGTVSAALARLLETDASSYTWVAAAVGANSAAGFQLATGRPVMAIGGFNGTDPTPTLARFEAYVAAGSVHYFISGEGGPGGGPGAGGSSDSAAITAWVEAHFRATTIDGVTVYDLTDRTS